MLEQAAALAGKLGESFSVLIESGDGEAVVAAGADEFKFTGEERGHAFDLEIYESGLGGSLTAETPEGGGHLGDEQFFDGVVGFPGLEIGGDDALEIGEVFAWEEEAFGVGSVGDGVGGGAEFAGVGFGAGGFEGVEAGGAAAVVIFSVVHGDFRVAGGVKWGLGKCLGINAEWIVMRVVSGFWNTGNFRPSDACNWRCNIFCVNCFGRVAV